LTKIFQRKIVLNQLLELAARLNQNNIEMVLIDAWDPQPKSAGAIPRRFF